MSDFNRHVRTVILHREEPAINPRRFWMRKNVKVSYQVISKPVLNPSAAISRSARRSTNQLLRVGVTAAAIITRNGRRAPCRTLRTPCANVLRALWYTKISIIPG